MTMKTGDETEFLLMRAQEEAVQAIRSDKAEAEAVHQELALRYSARALHALVRNRGGNQP